MDDLVGEQTRDPFHIVLICEGPHEIPDDLLVPFLLHDRPTYSRWPGHNPKSSL